jgi:hypothetical protein|nr:MAG TPA: hypothetical protein [Caudoviricetes sp.]
MSAKKVIEIAKELYESCKCCSIQGTLDAVGKLQEYMIGDEKDIDLQFMTSITHPMGMIMDASILIPTSVCSTFEFEIKVSKSFEGKVYMRADIQKVGNSDMKNYFDCMIFSPNDLERVIVVLKHMYEREAVEIDWERN